MSVTPWTPERRSVIKRRIDKEAARAAARLNATTVLIVAFFEDGEYLHMQDGGSAPIDFSHVYKTLASATEILKESSGEDVALS
jgi:hypothetical protein